MSDWRLREDLQALDRARQPTAKEQARIHQGVAERLLTRSRSPGVGLRAAAAVAALAMAAGLAVAVLGQPAAQEHLLTAVEPVNARLGDEVSLAYVGTGQAVRTAEKVEIQWQQGSLHTEVEPERGIELAVTTPEATVRVVGTVFDVSRDDLGTEVSVSRGEVELTCQGEAAVHLVAGGRRHCFRNAAAALHAARTARTPGEALAILERGRMLSGSEATHRELAVWRIEALRALGREDDALHAAEAYLRGGALHRRAEVLRIASELAFQRGGCDEAERWLAELAALPDAPAAAKEQWAACQEEER